MTTETAQRLTCDMVRGCSEHVTHIDERGFVYCSHHGEQRKNTMKCRRLTKIELETLWSGKPLERYDHE